MGNERILSSERNTNSPPISKSWNRETATEIYFEICNKMIFLQFFLQSSAYYAFVFCLQNLTSKSLWLMQTNLCGLKAQGVEKLILLYNIAFYYYCIPISENRPHSSPFCHKILKKSLPIFYLIPVKVVKCWRASRSSQTSMPSLPDSF